jgi:hypothetical protein
MTAFRTPFRSRPRPRSVPALVLGLSLLLGACGGAGDQRTGPGALPEDTTPIAVDEPAPFAEQATDEDPAEDPGPTDGPVDDVAEAPAPGSDPAAGDCSAAGETLTPVPAGGLPAEVAAMRDLLIDAALRCDEQLLFTAMEESEQFTFSFGGDPDALSLWWAMEAAGDEPFLRLAQVLATTPALAESGETYVWPRVTTGRPQDTTQAAWDELVWLDESRRGDASGDGYLDWRVGISTGGQWRFFVTGD